LASTPLPTSQLFIFQRAIKGTRRKGRKKGRKPEEEEEEEEEKKKKALMKTGKKRTADSIANEAGAEGNLSTDSAPVVDDLEAKRRKDVLKDMEKIEKEFDDLKEKLFAKKIKDLQDECRAIMDGTRTRTRTRTHPSPVGTWRWPTW